MNILWLAARLNLTPVLAGVRTRGAFTRIFRTEPIFNAGALVVDGMRIEKNLARRSRRWYWLVRDGTKVSGVKAWSGMSL